MKNRGAKKYHFLAIAGIMGSGKTTAGKLLAQKLKLRFFEENAKGNSFLPLFYEDPKRWAFHSQLFYLREKIAQLVEIKALLNTRHVLQDSPIFQDYLTYARAQQIAGHMTQEEFSLYENLFLSLHNDLPQPDLIIHLNVSSNVLQERIQKRGHGYEKKVPKEYLETLSSLQDEWIAKRKDLNTIIIDTNTLNLESSQADQNTFVNEIQKLLSLNIS